MLSQLSQAPVFCIWLLEGDVTFHVRISLGCSRLVKKARFMPAQLAHQLARKLQAKLLGTMAVL